MPVIDRIDESKIEISVIAPMFNEEESIEAFLASLRNVLESVAEPFEVILVDDGSSDDSVKKVHLFGWSDVKVIRFVKNAGHMAALDAGLRSARGRYVITMDSDLQHPPELITELLAEAKAKKADVVYAVRSSRDEEGFFKRTTSRLYYKVMRMASGVPLVQSAADYRLITSRVVDVIKVLPPGNNIFRVLIPSMGFPSSQVNYVASQRFGGASKYKFHKMASLAISSVVGHSTKPLQFATLAGMTLTCLSFVGLIYVLIVYVAGNSLEGWASLASISLLMFGLVFLMLGVIGRYLAEVLKRLDPTPIYLIDKQRSEDDPAIG